MGKGIFLITCFFVFFIAALVSAGLLDSAIDTIKSVGEQYGTIHQPQSGNKDSVFSHEELIVAFKEALSLGAKRAVETASTPGGFLDNPAIHIPFPGRLRQAATILRSLGMGSQLSAFEETMNRAAEKASAKAFPIFAEAVKEITFDDAKRLFNGGDMAITQYFREKTWDKLYQSFLPVIHETAQQVGVTQKYQAIITQPAIKQLVAKTDFDLDHYVSTKALEGLFTLLGQEEKHIRENPVARSTDLLKKVFGVER